jgi:hypothetical protein
LSINFTQHSVSPAQFLEGTFQAASPGSLCVAVGSALYFITSAQVGTSQATQNLWIMKSTDGGATWTQKYNAAHVAGGSNAIAAVAIGTTIYIASVVINLTALKIFRYDTTSDTFLSDSATMPNPSGTNRPFCLGAFGVAGTLLVVYQNDNDGTLCSNVYTIGSNTWGTQQVLDAAPTTAWCPLGLAMQTTADRGFVFYVDEGGTHPLKVIPVKPAAAGTAKTLIASQTGSFPNGDFANYRPGLPIVWNSDAEVVFPYLNPASAAAPSTNALVVFRALVADNPTFTSETVAAAGSLGAGIDITIFPDTIFGPVACCFEVTLGTLTVLFLADNNQGSTGSSSSQSFIYYATNTGAGLGWSAATLAFSSAVPNEPLGIYPAGSPGTFDGLFYGQVNPVVFFGVGTKYASLTNLFLANGSSPPVLSCNNPPVGVVGVAYSHALSVSGGTAPFTYAITAGALPTGLTLGASTGIISGTPQAGGTFTFTVQVTDAAAATSSVTCSIAIGAFELTLIGAKRWPRERPPEGCAVETPDTTFRRLM